MTGIEAFYGSFYQQPLLLAVPSMLWLAVLFFKLRPRDGVWTYCAAFAALSIVDAFMTANHVIGIGSWPGMAAMAVPAFFVVLGDFRAILWTYPGAMKKKWPVCLALSLAIPVVMFVFLRGPLNAAGVSMRVMFLLYELMFLGFFTTLTLSVSGMAGLRSPYVRYVLLYYALWATADTWLLAADHGDPSTVAAWMLRIGANLLYYAGWTPWVYWHARKSPPSL